MPHSVSADRGRGKTSFQLSAISFQLFNGCSPPRADVRCEAKILFLNDFTALGEFFPRDYTGLSVRQQFRQLDIQSLQKGERSWIGCRDAQTTASSLHADFCRAQRLELMQSL